MTENFLRFSLSTIKMCYTQDTLGINWSDGCISSVVEHIYAQAIQLLQ